MAIDLFPSLGDTEPTATASPRSPDELADAVRSAVAAGHAVVPHGGGTGQDYGYPLRAGAFTLIETSGMNRIVAVEPGDLTITVESGVTLAAVQAALRPHGLLLPLDPPHPERATVGGILATNAFGASRLGYGTARDWLIGLSVVNAEGKLVKGGGRVVKNVTGYDIPKLHIGALGTLGVLAEATFKVAPLPETTRTVVASLPAGRGSVGVAASRILARTNPSQSYRRTDAHGDFFVCVYEGFAEVVAQEADFARDALRVGASVEIYAEGLEEADDVPVFSLRLDGDISGDDARHDSVLPNAVLTEELGTVVRTLYGTGVTDIQWGRPAVVPADQVTTFSTGITGRVYTHAPLDLRQKVLRIWSPEPASLPLMRRIKTALDPGDLFNPGRFVVR